MLRLRGSGNGSWGEVARPEAFACCHVWDCSRTGARRAYLERSGTPVGSRKKDVRGGIGAGRRRLRREGRRPRNRERGDRNVARVSGCPQDRSGQAKPVHLAAGAAPQYRSQGMAELRSQGSGKWRGTCHALACFCMF